MERPNILYVDAYDSFSNNVTALLETAIKADVYVVKIDDEELMCHKSDDAFVSYLHQFDAIVVGPGPGNPTKAQDIGWVNRLWQLEEDDLLPILGICLGFQSLCLAFGAKVVRLTEPRHGLVLEVNHCGSDMFAGLDDFNATMYHSLHVDLGYSGRCDEKIPRQLSDGASRQLPPETSQQAPMLQPLAWDLQDAVNGPVLLAARHKTRPFWGVQFHPESITTGARIVDGQLTFDSQGSKLIEKWWAAAAPWRKTHSKRNRPLHEVLASSSCHTRTTALTLATSLSTYMAEQHYTKIQGHISISGRVSSTSIPSRGISVPLLCEEFDLVSGQAVILHSGLAANGKPLREDTGRYSILGVLDEDALITINQMLKPNAEVVLRYAKRQQIAASVTNFWAYLKRWMELLSCSGGASDLPFWGGLVGFITYEAGLDTISVQEDASCVDANQHCAAARPASTFTVVTRSIVVDHLKGRIYVQSVRTNDNDWIETTAQRIENATNVRDNLARYSKVANCSSVVDVARVEYPGREVYEDKVIQCQLSIRSGDSYELCLTDQTRIYTRNENTFASSAWPLYLKIAAQNAAPFSAYIQLQSGDHSVSILSSSPERFLSWNRTGRCQYRPIKGTVKKEAGMTLKEAEAILKPSLNAKDVAENLMITDLIRHDLHGVVGAENVTVPKLFGVEEYQTVFQLVSVIEGQLPPISKSALHDTPSANKPCTKNYERSNGLATPESDGQPDALEHLQQQPTGIDVLAASLPPGSMTGAPKKRSCEILQQIEGKPRGIYSGVLGYLDVGGGGDFSVIIRTAFRWSDDIDNEGNDIWTIGAGGAVTSQSTPEGEEREMRTKLDSVLRAFESP